MSEVEVEKLLLKVKEAADAASISRSKAYELVRAGVWPSLKIGAAVRIPLSGLRTWIDEQQEEV